MSLRVVSICSWCKLTYACANTMVSRNVSDPLFNCLGLTQMKWIWFYIWVYTLFQIMSMPRKWVWYMPTQMWYNNGVNIERWWLLSYGNATLSPFYDQAIPTRSQAILHPVQVKDHFDVLDNPKVFSPKTADRWPVLASLHKTHFSVLFLSNGPLI